MDYTAIAAPTSRAFSLTYSCRSVSVLPETPATRRGTFVEIGCSRCLSSVMAHTILRRRNCSFDSTTSSRTVTVIGNLSAEPVYLDASCTERRRPNFVNRIGFWDEDFMDSASERMAATATISRSGHTLAERRLLRFEALRIGNCAENQSRLDADRRRNLLFRHARWSKSLIDIRRRFTGWWCLCIRCTYRVVQTDAGTRISPQQVDDHGFDNLCGVGHHVT